jgi:hypothetical protein
MQLTKAANAAISIVTLDSLIATHPALSRTRLLKIDADGFDLRILRGGGNIIQETTPVLYFEYDPTFFMAHDPQGNGTITRLFESQYEGLVIYDHLGRRLLVRDRDQIEAISQVGDYLQGKRGMLPYVDICVTSRADRDLFEKLREQRLDCTMR